ncbi:MAG: asparagine synthase (glutamine-hydrolyzing) [Gammaproteobacteria bacterium]|nr:asparagine synthase (glutamine-hydrolyzing) [Gammaproteobacteria bacterium]
MCGIAGIVSLSKNPIKDLNTKLKVMNKLIAHRGPDDAGVWIEATQQAGLAHRRLSIIDLSKHSHQPMIGQNGTAIIFNGEIYNYQHLQNTLKHHWDFTTHSDTETILAAYDRYGVDCVDHLRGMFAFALWDKDRLFISRDRFGIKPLYYTVVNREFIFASEVKALLPFLENIATDPHAFTDYITFQYPIGENTLFKDVYQLMPGHNLLVQNGELKIWRYWDVYYDIDYTSSAEDFQQRFQDLMHDSVTAHLTSDVPVGCYLSGGLDSSLISSMASSHSSTTIPFFHGRFLEGESYDESHYAKLMASQCNAPLHIVDITSTDFIQNFDKLIYHLDYPVAGPGAFPQFFVSKLVSQHVKVVLGGQGGDEIFGGYARYLLAYFEQCINAAIEGTYQKGNFVVTAESIIPQLVSLKEYKPMIKQFWNKGLFEDLDRRYFRLIDRSADITTEICWEQLDRGYTFERFLKIFNSTKNVRKESYFDSMTHFDFKCLLPGLLHVEDRVSMAHGIEARVPFLDHALVEFLATVPADVKFKDGQMKIFLKQALAKYIPSEIHNRRDKMGFPVPLNEWLENDLKDFVYDLMHTGKAKNREFINYDAVLNNLKNVSKYSRKIWAFLCLEQWHQLFHDNAQSYRNMIVKGE